MKCSKCGTEYEGNFCPKCGTAANLEQETCPVCGNVREDGKRYCSGCGHDFYSAKEKNKNIAAEAIAKVKKVPKVTWIILTLVIIIAIVITVLVTVLSNRFRLGVIEQINIGDSKEQVLDILGEPYDYE